MPKSSSKSRVGDAGIGGSLPTAFTGCELTRLLEEISGSWLCGCHVCRPTGALGLVLSGPPTTLEDVDLVFFFFFRLFVACGGAVWSSNASRYVERICSTMLLMSSREVVHSSSLKLVGAVALEPAWEEM